MDERTLSFLLGCAGGLGVTVYRLYEASYLPKEERPPYDAVYIFQAIGLSLLGGIWTLANYMTKPISPVTAISTGLSIPAVIKAGASVEAKKKNQRKKPRVD